LRSKNSQDGEDVAGELHPIIAVDLQGASEGGDVAMHQSLDNGGGALVWKGVEAYKAAEPILAGQDVPVSCRSLQQGPNQVDEQDLLGVPMAGWDVNTSPQPLLGDLLYAVGANLNPRRASRSLSVVGASQSMMRAIYASYIAMPSWLSVCPR
jgi:hypothetical protein